MKSTLSLALTAFVATLFITYSCQKSSHADPDPDSPDNPNTPVIEYVTAGVTGRVVDDANQPVDAAVVKVGATSTTTDINGNFTINSVSLNKNAGLVKVEKEGFFQGSRTIVVNTGVSNAVTIQLIPKKVSGTVNAGGGGDVTVPNGGKITFTGNSFTNTGNNSAYTGTVSVSSFFLNPTADNFNEIMPGTLRGINTSNEETGLQSFGMMAVELNGAGGEKLQLASGKTATITFPIPAGLLSLAPPTIPLWSFNDSSGLWKEEGTATKQGNNYVGTVGHFSFWNCDYPYGGVVDFKAIIKDQNGKPFYPGQVVLRIKTDSFTSYGLANTDSTGWVGGKVPINKTLTMYVYNKCNVPIYTKEVGPFTAAANLGTVTVTVSGPTTLNINGNLTDCNKNPVTNGYVDVFLDNVHNRAKVIDSKGNFVITISRCVNTPATAVITPIDMATNQSGKPLNLSVTSGTANAGNLIACGTSISEFANYTMNSVTYNFSNPTDSITLSKSGANYTMYVMHKNSSADYSSVTFAATGTGTGTLSGVSVRANNKSWHLSNPTTLTITEFGAIGTGYVAGNFSNKMADSTTTTQIDYSFRVKRTQ